jgi:hypothetical protein
MVDNGGKIIYKKRGNNLVVLTGRIINQVSEMAKKVSPFLIMIFKHNFSPLLAQFFGVNLSTLYVVNRLWITLASALVFSY